MSNLRKAIADIQFHGDIRFNEPMSRHTSFQVGGPADVLLTPQSQDDIVAAIGLARDYPFFYLGAGANILVADKGIRGVVVDMTGLDSCAADGTTIVAEAGAAVSDASMLAAEHGLTGIEFIYAMPGSVGGAVWMNARCYGKSISEVLTFVDVVTENGERCRMNPAGEEFAYKQSPFQKKQWAIIRAGFTLAPGDRVKILATMKEHRLDREAKGHFAAPSVGSIFKNNRQFGMPSGKLIDSLSLRGETLGGARVSESHANIIVNSGGATATDIRELIRLIERKVREAYGFELEQEVLLVGDWSEEAADER